MTADTVRALCDTQDRIDAVKQRAAIVRLCLPLMPWHLRLYARLMVSVAMVSVNITQRDVDRKMKVYTRG